MIYEIRVMRVEKEWTCNIPEGKTTCFIKRLLLKLKERDFELDDNKDVLAVYFKEESNKCFLTAYCNQKWVAEHIVNVPENILKSLDKNPAVIADKLEEILSIYATEKCTADMIHAWVKDALNNGDCMESVLQERKYYKRKAVLSVRYLDSGMYLPILRVYDTDNKLVLQEMLPCTKYLSVLDVMEFKNGCVTIRSKKKALMQQTLTVECKDLFKRRRKNMHDQI